MGGFGDLSEFFDENKNQGDKIEDLDFYSDGVDKVAKRPVWDGNWLEINPAEYNSVQRLPDNEKRLNSLNQLENLWDHTQKIKRLNPTDNLFFSPDSPVRLENSGQTKESSQDVYATWGKIAQDVRKQITLGKDSEEISFYLNNKYAAEDIKIAASTIDLLLENEYGILGNVYIDPTVFQDGTPIPKSCEKGAKELKNKAKTARYLKAMPNCDGCVFNQAGSCSKFNRTIVHNLNYTNRLAQRLTDDLIARGKITKKEASEILKSPNPIEGIKKAFVFVKEAEKRVGGVQAYPQVTKLSKEDLEEKISDLSKSSTEEKKLAAALEYQKEIKPIWNYTGKQIIQGHKGATLRKRVASKFGPKFLEKYGKSLSNLLGEQGLLGKFYISTEPWDWNCKKAKEEISATDALSSPFIQRTPKCANCVFNHKDSCSLFKKEITANFNDVDLQKTYPNIIEELYQSKRIAKEERDWYLQQKPSLEILKQAYLHTKKKQDRVGGVKGKMMPLRTPKVAKLTQSTPATNFLKKEMHRGSASQLIYSRLRQKFASQELGKEDLPSTVKKELGLLGNVYIDPDVYKNCKVGANELNPKAKLAFVKASSKCFGCKYNKEGSCQVYKKPLLGQVDWEGNDIINWDKVASAHYNYLLGEKKLNQADINSLKEIPDQLHALKLAYTLKRKNSPRVGGVQVNQREEQIQTRDKVATIQAVTNAMVYHMNNGKFGSELANILKKSFDKEALEWARPSIEKLSAEEVLLGNVYVNPEYNGGNCEKQANYVRKNSQVNYVQLNSKCAGCVFNKGNKACGLIKRPLTASINYDSKLAQHHIGYLSGLNRLDSNFKIASDPRQAIKSAYFYIKPKKVRLAGVQHTEQTYNRKPKLNRQKLASFVATDFQSGMPYEEILKKYAAVPKFELDKVIADFVQNNTYKVEVVPEKKKAEIDYISEVDHFGLDSDFSVEVDNTNDLLDMGDYLDI